VKLEADIPKWKTEMRQLASHSFALIQAKGSWGLSNAGLIVSDNHAVVIDTLNSNSVAETFIKEIKSITDKRIQYIVLTHSHPDHLRGSLLLPEAFTICHNKCYEELKEMSRLSGSEVLPGVQLDFIKAVASLNYITFENIITLCLDKLDIKLHYYGLAHTNGDILVHFQEDGIVFCGDLLFLYSTPIALRGSIRGWIETIKKILELDASIYVPGHGPPCDRNGVKKCQEYLLYVYDEAQKSFAAGIQPREAAARIPLGEFRQWADPERILGNVRSVYRELGNKGLAPLPEVIAGVKEMQELAKTGW
jgi:cyclase